MNKNVRFKSVVAASLLKFDVLDNLDISLIIEDLKKLSFHIWDIGNLEELRKYVKIRKNGYISLEEKLSLDSFANESENSTVREELEKVVTEEIKEYFEKLDVEQFRKRKMDFLKAGKDKLLRDANILLISDREEEYDELIKYGFSRVDYFKSIIRADRYFEKNPDEAAKYHMILVGSQSVVWNVSDQDKFLKQLKEKNTSIIWLSRYDYSEPIKLVTHLRDFKNYRYWEATETEYSKIFDDILECTVLNKMTEKIENSNFIPIKDCINPNKLPLPEKKSDLKILYFDSMSINEHAEEIAKELGLNITFRDDNNFSLTRDTIYVLGDYDIIIASDMFSRRLLSMDKESTEQCKDTGRNLVVLVTYKEEEESRYDNDSNSHFFGYQIDLRYSFGGKLDSSSDIKKSYQVLDNQKEYCDFKERYQHGQDTCMKSIIESAVELYNEALEKRGLKKLQNLNFKTSNQYNLEYENAINSFQEQKEKELEPIQNFNNLKSRLEYYLEYKKQGLVPRDVEGVRIEEAKDTIRVVNIIGGIEYCSMTIKKEDRYLHLKRFTIQTRSKKGILGDDEEVGVYTKKYEGMEGVPPRLNDHQQGAFTSICKKVKTVVNPLIADALLKKQEMAEVEEKKPKQKGFGKRKRNKENNQKK